MKKLEMYTIYNITNGDLGKEEWAETELLDREISLQANNLIRKYLIFKGLEEKDQFIENIIKVSLPHNKDDKDNETPLEVLKNGIIFRGKKFIPLISSPSMMKKEGQDDYYKKDFKCEYFFISKEDEEFIKIFEMITSGSELTERFETRTQMAINKDVVARLALNTSSSYSINYRPNIVILPTDTYTYTANYCYFANQDYSELKYSEVTKEHEFQDGCGLMSPEMSGIIQQQMKVDYPVDFAIIRQDPLAVKGLVVKVDFNKYFDDMYKEDNKGVFEKREDGFYTLDYFGKMVNISKADLIINTNMAKWAKWWKQDKPINIMEEVDKELRKEKYDKYRALLLKLYVTKINKREPKEYSLTNYQFISNLALTPKELNQLQQETYDMYKKVLSMDVNYIRLLMQDIATDDTEELGSMDKIHYLLQSTEEALTIPSVRQQVVRMVRKKINLLAEGKFYVKGHYKIASTCPVTFMDWIMCRDLNKCNRGLEVREYYIPKETGKRVISRNPLNSFSEIQKVEITKNDLLEKYCGELTSEIAFFNQKDDTFMIESGEDADGDCNLWVDSDVIYNSVVEPEDGYNFCNMEDNKDTVEHEYTKENEYYCIVKAAGNKIGTIANVGTKISTMCTEMGYYCPKNDATYGYKELEEGYYEKKKEFLEKEIYEIKKVKDLKSQMDYIVTQLKEFDYMMNDQEIDDKKWEIQTLSEQLYDYARDANKKKREYFTKALKEKIDNKELIEIDTLEEDKIRELLIQQFYNYKTLSYKALQLQMLSIDIPKTLKEIDNKEIKSLKEDVLEKKDPVFRKYNMPYKDRFDKNGRERYFSLTHSVLNLHAKNVARTLMAKDLERVKKETDNYAKADRVGCTNKILSNADITDKTEEVIPLLKGIFSSWKNEAERIRATYKDNKVKKNEELRKNNLIISKSIMILSDRYDLNTMASGLLKMSKSTNSAIRTKFMIDCCFNVIQALLDLYYNDITTFEKDANGKYDWMFKKYNKIKTNRKETDLQAMQIKEEQLKQEEIIEIKFRPVDLEDGQTLSKKNDKFYINDEIIFNNKVKGCKGKKTYDQLEELLKDKTELGVILKDITNKPTYIVAYIHKVNA
ncbi:hypothetical protein [Clostridium brassicae]|uniref:Uncharacterized protein n=1 Tax=Clostridium brassicae TaxID=2999072 RepID=A0ABT4D7M2_9CLOT|nr:hypothetical protein [Clostridium brassicae]MCY6958297.1 hypothetical protein [Clostridium brassicae]